MGKWCSHNRDSARCCFRRQLGNLCDDAAGGRLCLPLLLTPRKSKMPASCMLKVGSFGGGGSGFLRVVLGKRRVVWVKESCERREKWWPASEPALELNQRTSASSGARFLVLSLALIGGELEEDAEERR